MHVSLFIIAILTLLFNAAGSPIELPLNKEVTGQIGEDPAYIDYKFSATQAGILTVGFRALEGE